MKRNLNAQDETIRALLESKLVEAEEPAMNKYAQDEKEKELVDKKLVKMCKDRAEDFRAFAKDLHSDNPTITDEAYFAYSDLTDFADYNDPYYETGEFGEDGDKELTKQEKDLVKFVHKSAPRIAKLYVKIQDDQNGDEEFKKDSGDVELADMVVTYINNITKAPETESKKVTERKMTLKDVKKAVPFLYQALVPKIEKAIKDGYSDEELVDLIRIMYGNWTEENARDLLDDYKANYQDEDDKKDNNVKEKTADEIYDEAQSLKVKEWYLKEYPDDDMGNEINPNITFYDVFEALDTYKDIYKLLGVADSIVRERVFDKLDEILDNGDGYCYDQWLLATESKKITESEIVYTFQLSLPDCMPEDFTDDWSVESAKDEYMENEGSKSKYSRKDIQVVRYEEPNVVKIGESKKITESNNDMQMEIYEMIQTARKMDNQSKEENIKETVRALLDEYDISAFKDYNIRNKKDLEKYVTQKADEIYAGEYDESKKVTEANTFGIAEDMYNKNHKEKWNTLSDDEKASYYNKNYNKIKRQADGLDKKTEAVDNAQTDLEKAFTTEVEYWLQALVDENGNDEIGKQAQAVLNDKKKVEAIVDELVNGSDDLWEEIHQKIEALADIDYRSMTEEKKTPEVEYNKAGGFYKGDNYYVGIDGIEGEDFDKVTYGNDEVDNLWTAVCCGDLKKLKDYYENGGKPNQRYHKFGKDHSLIMGALRQGNKTGDFTEVVDYLKSQGETILDDEKPEYNKLTGKTEGKKTEAVKLDSKDVRDLKGALSTFNNNGRYAKRGNWSIGNGGYDEWYEIYYDGLPVIRCISGNIEVETDDEKFEQYAELVSSIYGDKYEKAEENKKVTEGIEDVKSLVPELCKHEKDMPKIVYDFFNEDKGNIVVSDNYFWIEPHSQYTEIPDKQYDAVMEFVKSVFPQYKSKDEINKKVTEAYNYNWRDDIEEVENSEETDDLAYAFAENMVNTDPDYAGKDPIEVLSNIISIWEIKKKSRLYDYLLKWYGSEEEMKKHIRSFYETNNAIYFETGCGYSIFSADLLGGTADGIAEQEFSKFVSNGGNK